MDNKERFQSLEELSNQAALKAREAQEQEKKKHKEQEERHYRLIKEFDPQVGRVYKQFVRSIGRKIAEKWDCAQHSLWVKLEKEDYTKGKSCQLQDVYPSVTIDYDLGVVIQPPDSLKERVPAGCEKPLPDYSLIGKFPRWKSWKSERELVAGYYYVPGETFRTRPYAYFIPFEDFTKEKLAAKLEEFYKEAMRYYLEQ
jgi:hypothetical protein